MEGETFEVTMPSLIAGRQATSTASARRSLLAIAGPLQIRIHGTAFLKNELVVEHLVARAQTRQSNLHLWPSQPSGGEDRLPKEHAKTCDHDNAKDKAPRVPTEGLLVVGGQPVGIAHAKLLGRPPASQPHQTLIKIS
jgi:hypothetical protein